jgi:hypothetical protein
MAEPQAQSSLLVRLGSEASRSIFDARLRPEAMGLLAQFFMRKFILHFARDGKISIMEVELELVPAIKDPSIMWLPQGEYRARVIDPKSLHEKQLDGSLTAPVWHSHAFYSDEAQAIDVAHKAIRGIFERDMLHYKIEYTEEDFNKKISEVEVIRLP